MKKLIGKRKYIGEINLEDKVDITDPCYNKDVWCRMTTECKPGTYTGYAYISEKLATAILIKEKTKEKINAEEMECIGSIGVDSGLAGFFNDKPDYSRDEWPDFCKMIYEDENNGLYNKIEDYGLISSSGFGDGDYNVYASPSRDVFVIQFI